ncbi:DUF4129 domain-containing protein [Mycolicibacter longobardus]|nr:DUF4129 domain-containing protein [Mycolicibacter longobardus]
MTAGSDRTTVRMIALIALLLVTGAATRGYLPGTTRGPRPEATAGPVEPIVLVALLAISTAAIIVAVVHRARHQRAAAGSIGQLSVTAGAAPQRPPWRVVLIILAGLALWLLTILLLANLEGALRFAIPVELFGSRETAPAAPGTPGTAPPSTPGGPAGAGSGYLLALSTMLLALIAIVVVATRTRRPDPRPPETAVVPAVGAAPDAGETLAQAAELGLSRVADRGRGPREAIISCYAVMEQHLGTVPDVAPRDFDTPTEVLARAVEHHALPADNASRLVELFTEARFSAHLMTERHREDAVAALRLVLDELRSQR